MQQRELDLDFSAVASQWTLKEWIQYLFIEPEFSLLFHHNRQHTQVVASAWKHSINQHETIQSVDQLIPEQSYVRDVEFESPTNAPAIVTKFIGVEHAFCFQKETLTLHPHYCSITSNLIFNTSKQDLLASQNDAPVQILCSWTVSLTLQCNIKVDFLVRNKSQSWWMEKLQGTIASVLWKQTEENLLALRDDGITYLNQQFPLKEAAAKARKEEMVFILPQREEGEGEEEMEIKSTTSFEDALSTFSSITKDEEEAPSAMLLYQQLQQIQMEQNKLQLKCKQLEQEVPALSTVIASMLQQFDAKWKYLQQLQQNGIQRSRLWTWRNAFLLLQLLEIALIMLYVVVVFRKSIWKFFNEHLFQFLLWLQKLVKQIRKT